MSSPSSSWIAQDHHLVWEAEEAEAVEACSPDGRHIAVGGPNHSVEVWDARLRHRWLTYTGHQDGLYRRASGQMLALAWSPDGRCIASLSSNGSLQVWDARTGIHQRTLLPASSEAVQASSQEQACELRWETDGLRLLRQRGQEQEQRLWPL